MGRSPSCDGKVPVKKGPWTPEEDMVLMDYIQRHGSSGNWQRIPKLAGLNRCGKSCRLRWTNYLRPDIERGPFTDDDEKTIIHLHSMHGNKWSAIATHLPGRTGNFIKNYWNMNLRKKLLHMGINPVMHSPPTDLSLLTGLAGHPAGAAGNSLSGVSMPPSASNTNASQPHTDVTSLTRGSSDINTHRIKDKATSFTFSYSNMKPPRIKDEATSFTGSYLDMKPPRIKDKASSFPSSYSDMKPPRIKDEAASFTGSYLDMKPLRLQDEAASFTGSYSDVGTGWDMNAFSMHQANAAKFQLLQGHRWVTSASLGAMKALVEKLDMLLLAPSSPQKFSSKRVKDGMRLLKDDVEEISSYLDELSELEDPPPIAKCWMNEVRDLSYDMEDYIHSLLFAPSDCINKNKKRKKKRNIMIKKRLKWYKHITYVTQVSEHGIKTTKRIHVSVVPRLRSKPKIAEIISEFRIYVQEATERHDRYKLHCCSNLRRRTFVSTGSMLPMPYEENDDHIVIDGRMNEFINSLAIKYVADQQQLKVVSVLGPGCLGKTTLAKVLYNRIRMQVNCKAFIRLSKKPDMKTLLCDLFSQLHHRKQPLPANHNELGLSDNISKYLQDKRYLIVIDDLWDASVWDIIKYAFPNGNRGSRIIITTQIEDVALTCCCDHSEHVFEMKPLDDDHSRMLFFNRLFGSENDCPAEFKQVSNEIIDMCGGLPLATINIASHLANQQTAVSLNLLTYIRDSLKSHLWSSSTSERTRQVLTLSYNNLPHYLKTCFLYLHMYPQGSVIWKDDLVKQWVAEGFIATRKWEVQDQETIEKAAGIYFDELIDRRFLQPLYINYNNKVLSCTVHDVVRDLIAQKSAEENFIVVVDYNRKSISLPHKVRRLSLVFGDAKYAKTPANITKSQVRSLTFCGLFECMPCIREFKVLRVLNLQVSGHCGDHDPLDLTGISELFQLKYLKIASDVCIKLPNRMRGLQCLETLDVMDVIRVTVVPWDIMNLPHLLHLSLPVDTNLLDWICSMSDPVISLSSLGKLNYLQDLYLTSPSTHPFYHPERSTEALGSLIGGHGNLKTIVVAPGSSVKKIMVRGTPKVTISWDCMAPPPLLQRFECSRHSHIIFYRIPRWVKELGNLCILKIAVKELQMICVGILRGLHALTALSLYVETVPLDKIIFDKAGFTVLKHFKLRFTSGIAWLKFEADAMPNLWNLKLVFNDSPRMDQDPFISSNQASCEAYQHGTALINIEHMPGLKEISAKFEGATADVEYALRIGISNHPSNPAIKVPSGGYSSYCDRRANQKQQPNDKRISRSQESSSHLHVPDIEGRVRAGRAFKRLRGSGFDFRVGGEQHGAGSNLIEQHSIGSNLIEQHGAGSNLIEQYVARSNLIGEIGRELSISCILHLSRSDYGSVASLNREFNSLVRTGEIYRQRRHNGVVEDWIYFSLNAMEWGAYDLYRERWIKVPKMPPDECFMSSHKESLAVGTELLVYGNGMYRYSILTNSWGSAVPMNSPRSLFGSASVGEKAYVAGGTDSSGRILSSAEMYNSETHTWTPLPRMNRERHLCSGVFMDGKFYVIGGVTNYNKGLTCGEEYDLNRRSWTVIENLCEGLNTDVLSGAPPLFAVVNNELYAADYRAGDVKRYDKMNNKWITLGKLPQPSAVAVNGRDLAFRACGDRLIVVHGARTSTADMVEFHSWVPGQQPPVWNLVATRRSESLVFDCAVMGC